MQAEYVKLQDRVAELEAMLDCQRKELEEAQEEPLKFEHEEMKQDHEETKHVLEETKKELGSLDIKYKMLKRLLEVRLEAKQELRDRIKTLQIEANAYKKKIKWIETENISLVRENTELKLQTDTLITQYNRMQGILKKNLDI